MTNCPKCNQQPRQVNGKFGLFWSCPKLSNGTYCQFRWNQDGTGPKKQQIQPTQQNLHEDNKLLKEINDKLNKIIELL